MNFRRLASWLLLLAAALAPWLAGARSSLPGVLWGFGFALFFVFILVIADGAVTRRWPRIPPLVAGGVGLLLAAVTWWAFQPEPVFATPFAAEHWDFLARTFPNALLQWPRGERLFFAAAVLLGFLAAVDLGSCERFRRRMGLVIGIDGLVITLYALGQHYAGWAFPPWLRISGYTEVYNATFFHHSGPAGCLNFAWPLLVFRCWRRESLLPNAICAAVVLPIVALAIPLWQSQSAWGVSLGLFLAGAAWLILQRMGKAAPWLIVVTIFGIFFAGFAWQFRAVQRMKAQYPDHWVSARQTQWVETPARDARFRAKVAERGDRMIPSPAPPRPAGWLTAGRMALDHPFLGNGPGSWVKQSVLYSNDSLVNTFYQLRQFAHHDLLQTAAEWGLVPALICAVLWFGGLSAAVRRDPAGRTEIALVLALVAMGFHSQLHFPLQIPALQIWTAVMLGCAWSFRSEREPVAALPRPVRKGRPQVED